MTRITTFKALRQALKAHHMDCWGHKAKDGYKLATHGQGSCISSYDDLPSLLLAGNQALRQAQPTRPARTTAEIGEHNRRLMFGANDEAFPGREAWSRITD
jgi:hypothetical protein